MKDFKDSLTISRRNLLKAGATVGAVALLGDMAPLAYAAGEQITIFTWETYHDDDWIQQWTSWRRRGGGDEGGAQRKADVQTRTRG